MLKLTRLSILCLVLFGVASSAFADDGSKPETVKVFILAGQSNMVGAGIVSADPKRNGGKGTLEYLAKHHPDSPYAEWRNASDDWSERDDVWIHYMDKQGKLRPGYGGNEDRIGPELGFGQVVGDHFDEPVLLIKIAWGGKSLAVDFRPPSAGGDGPGPYYQELISRSKEVLNNVGKEFPELKGKTPELVGFGWHQGWNDRINQAFNDAYAENLAHFIRDIRKEFQAPKLPFVIAETGMSGFEEKHPRALSLMKAQASVPRMPEFKGNTAFVGTKAFFRPKEESPSGQAYHWNTNAETYYLIGAGMGNAMLDLLKEK